MIHLFSQADKRDVCLSFAEKKDISTAHSSLTGSVFQIVDQTDLDRQVILDFDLAGRILAVALRSKDFLPLRILDRSFQGTYYVYVENCKNLFHDGRVSYYYDYYQEITSNDVGFAEMLYRQIHTFVCSLQSIPAPFEEVVRSIVSYGWEVLEGEKQRLLCVYPSSISVVPPEVRPDQNPVFALIQITNGCWTHALKRGPCAFCASYAGQPFREKTPSEVAAHIDMVKAYCGRAWQSVRKLFLLDADPLFTKFPSTTYLSLIREKIGQMASCESFVSTSCILSKSVDEWKELMALGLKKVYWGVESANDSVLQVLQKPHSNEMLYRAARVLQEAGLEVVAIVMSGVGFFCDSRGHVADTGRFIADSHCATVDISKFQALKGTPLHRRIERGELHCADSVQIEEEHRLLIREISIRAPHCNVRGSYGRQFL